MIHIIQKRIYLLLFIVVLTAAFLRFYNIASNPPSLTWDEVALGYNAYTLGLEGRDEYGRFMPVTYLESFGDYKPPMYSYLDIIPVKIFGMNEFAVRLPSALLGTLTVLLTFFLVRRIFKDHKHEETIALLAALLLAISPWHIMLSRAAFEANVASFFIVGGVWLFLKSAQEKSWYILLSALFFVASFYTFNSARIVSPLLAIGLAIPFYKSLLQMKKKVVVVAVVALVLLLPALQFLNTPQAKTRFHEVNIFSNIEIAETVNQQVENDDGAFYSKLLHNYRLVYATEYLKHYLDHFNSKFLFISGDENPKFSTQHVGQMYLWSLPFLLIGTLLLIHKREKFWWIVPFWLLIAIIPAGTARETPHALRIEATLPTFQILVAYGLLQSALFLREKLNKKSVYTATLGILGVLLFTNFLYFYNGLMTSYPKTFSGVWQHGYIEALKYTQEREDAYDRILFTDMHGRPYIYHLFYNQIDPEFFRNNSKIDRGVFGLVDVRRVGKYHFLRDLPISVSDDENILYVNHPDKVPQDAQILKTISSLEGDEQFVIYEL